MISDEPTQEILPARWTPLRSHPEQKRLSNSPARFKVVPAGRRSGKTEKAKRHLVACALSTIGGRFCAAAPTRQQAKDIYWQDLKRLVPKWARKGKPKESELKIELINDSELFVAGMDRPQRIEGQPLDGIVLDEYADMKEEAWKMHIRPCLSDRQGWAWFIGVPEGRNHYYKMYQRALRDETGQWAGFHWKSSDILPQEEVDAARNDLDELTFRQEYEAEFVNFEGQAYYPFNQEVHVGNLLPLYNKVDRLLICFDFNVSPGIAAICQETELPCHDPIRHVYIDGQDVFGGMRGDTVEGTAVLGEVYIPRNSNTIAVCNKIIQDWGDHEGQVVVYGDATGGARGTAKVQGTDWDLIRETLGKHFGYNRLKFRVPMANPPVRGRINAMNSRLRSGDGTIRMMVHNECMHIIDDFEGVRLLEGGSGEIDKKRDPELTHLTDGLGYYIVEEFPVRKLVGRTQQVIL